MGLHAFGMSIECEIIKLIIRFQAEISDATGTHWIMAFRNEAEAIIGITADEFGDHKLNVNRSSVFL